MVRPRAFLDFSIDGTAAGRVVFELFNDVVPKSCENFRALCTGELGQSKVSSIPLSYKGSSVHRSIPDFMIQGGDFTRHNGKGGESIYGAPFDDEDLTRELDSEGLLVMANKGPNTNGSQWFVTLRACPHLNGKHVVFGRVVFGYDVVTKIAGVPVDEKDRPLTPVVVSHCGELELKKVAPKAVAVAPLRSRSISSTSDPGGKKKRRHSDSASDRTDSENDGERHKRSSKQKHRSSSKKDKEKSSSKHKSSSKSKKRRESASPPPKAKDEDAMVIIPREETLEELDARLEREENERIAAGKQQQVEALRQREPVVEASGGVNYKGRGRMKFKDPETDLQGW